MMKADADQALTLTTMSVDVSIYDGDAMAHEDIMSHCDLAASVLASHLRAAKRELVSRGVNLNWDESL